VNGDMRSRKAHKIPPDSLNPFPSNFHQQGTEGRNENDRYGC